MLGTSKLLKSIMFLKKMTTIIVVTSDKCYDTEKNKSFVETDKLVNMIFIALLKPVKKFFPPLLEKPF